MVVNAAQLASYSQAKEVILKHGALDLEHFITAEPAAVHMADTSILLHFYASMISGLVTTIASMPVDIVKTRCADTSRTSLSPRSASRT